MYNRRSHESLDRDPPGLRWEADSRELRFVEDKVLHEAFVVTEERKVSKDHIIQFDNTDYEAPMGLARQKVRVRRHVLTGELSVLHDGRVVKLHPVEVGASRGQP